MTGLDIPHQRLLNQHIARATFEKHGDVVQWLGAVQAQDYLGALWAVGLRMRRATEAAVEQAIADRSIVRTWPMRGTLHFVAPADARWMLRLMTPRIIAASAKRLLQNYDLDEATFARSRALFQHALQGGKQLTRAGMYEVLEAGHIPTANQRGLQILWRVAQEGLICFGPRQGRQQSFVLLDEWVPPAKTLERDEALAELANRYFTSHGPATVQDFAWWSGLTIADAQAGLEMARPHLAHETIAGQTYWLAPNSPPVKDMPPTAYLLPNYDEYTVGYKDRSAIFHPAHAQIANSGAGVFSSPILLNGQVVGTWKRVFTKDAVVITPSLYIPLTQAQQRAFSTATQQYGAFLGLPIAQNGE